MAEAHIERRLDCRSAFHSRQSLKFQPKKAKTEWRREGALRCCARGIRFSFAFRPVEDWFHPSAARLRRAGLCATQFSRLSFAFFPRSEHVLPSLARLDLVRNLA
jgi:hypothetical protein